MGRYWATGGIRDRLKGIAFPFALIIGPSGNAVQIPYPKGYPDDPRPLTGNAEERVPTRGVSPDDGSNNNGAGFPRGLAGYEHTFSHVQVEWFRNHLVNSFVDDATQGRNIGYAFQPYGQPVSGFLSIPEVNTGRGQPRINSFLDLTSQPNFNPQTNLELFSSVMMDGFNWMQPFDYNPIGFRSFFGFKRIGGGACFWTYKLNDNQGHQYGLWEAKFPHLLFRSEVPAFANHLAQVGSGFWGQGGSLPEPNDQNDFTYTAGKGGAPGGIDQYCGVAFGGGDMAGLSVNVNDIISFRGHIYVATQHAVMCVHPGGRYQVIMDDRSQDTAAGLITSKTDTPLMSTYTSRQQKDSFGGPSSKSFASHVDNQLYMLDNKGKVFSVRPGGIREIADLTKLGTFSSSGVFGGALDNQPLSVGAWGGSSSHRCKLVLFNRQLHAFLNFNSTFNVVKADNPDQPGFGRGIMWATSDDAVNWVDRTSLLPGSGIVQPSGFQIQWLQEIAPYKFSGTPGRVFPSGVLPDGNNTLDYPDPAGMAGPSGFAQVGVLPFWASGVGYIDSFDNDVGTSGVLLDAENTQFDQLNVPLQFLRIDKTVSPTEVINPAGYGFIDAASGRPAGVPLASGSGGVYSPSGVGASGLDYTGCRNYHVSAAVDDIDDKLNVIFSEDYDDGGTLYYELNKASGWALLNHIKDSNQLNGMVSIDMYDPEIIIPSGNLQRPNPSHNPVDSTVTIDYTILDWPFYRTVDVEVEYSINDGVEWRPIGTINNKSTGTILTDPSGLIGADHTFVWNYTTGPRPLSRSTFFKGVQIRMRGRDAGFVNPV